MPIVSTKKHDAPCPRCGAGGAIYTEETGVYENRIACSNIACQFESNGEWIDDPACMVNWKHGKGRDGVERHGVPVRLRKDRWWRLIH